MCTHVCVYNDLYNMATKQSPPVGCFLDPFPLLEMPPVCRALKLRISKCYLLTKASQMAATLQGCGQFLSIFIL